MMIRKNHVFAIIAFILIALTNCNDDSEETRIDIESMIDEIVERAINVSSDPGLTLLIQDNGKIVLRKAYGLANVQEGRYYQPETPGYIGSISKQFTATAVMILVERGLISIEQPIVDYFPEYPESWKNVTIHHLLTHQSGISDYLNDHGFTFDGMTNKDVLDYIFDNGYMNFEPGEMFKYSNTGYIILAELVEKISGKSLELFCEEEIFSPLGMDNTYFVNENIQDPNDIAVGHTLDGELFEYDIRTIGDGGMISTIDDMLLWDKSKYIDPIVSQQTLDIMMSPFSDMKNGAFYGYGYIIDDFNGYELPSGNGGYAGIFAYAGRNKEKNFYVCLMGNSPNYPLFEELISTILKHYLQ